MTESHYDDIANPAPASTEARAHRSASGGDPSSRWDWIRPIFIYAAALVLAVTVLFSVYLLARPIAILIASIIIAVALMPVVGWFERWLPRSLATVVVYLGVALIVVGIGFLLGFMMRQELATLIDEFPRDREDVENLVSQYAPFDESRIIDILRDQAGRYSNLIVMLPLMIVNTVVDIVLALFLSLYWVISAPSLRRFVLSLFPAGDRRERAAHVFSEIGSTMGGYVRASVLDGIIVAIITYVGLMLLGVRFPIVLAIFAGFMELIPVIGPIVSAIPAVILAFLDSPTKALLVLGFYVLLQQFESNVLMPNVMKNQADVPPLLSLFAVFAGGSLAGILGALIAVPVAGALMVLTEMVIAPAIRERWGPERPDSVQQASQQPGD